MTEPTERRERSKRMPKEARTIAVHGMTVDIIERIADTIQNAPDADASSLVVVLNLRGLVGAWDEATPAPPATD